MIALPQASSCRTILSPLRHCRRLLHASSSGVGVGQGEGGKWGGSAKMERTIIREYGKVWLRGQGLW